jgi:ABC-type uncharacterized transport system permease subunit
MEMLGILLYLTTALLYGALGFYFWRTRWHEGRASGDERSWERYAIVVPLALHGWLLSNSVTSAEGLQMGVGNALSAIAWMAVALYLIADVVYPFDGLQTFVAPVAAVCSLMPLVFAPVHPLPNTELIAFKAHVIIAMLAYGLFTIAALHGLLMTLVERRLHSEPLAPALKSFPPLLTMERLLFQIIVVAFVLLTLTLVSGVFFSEELFGKPVVFNHKTVFAFISWGIFAALLAGRALYGWRGRVAVRWVLTGFVMLLLAYVGSKFVLEVILQR